MQNVVKVTPQPIPKLLSTFVDGFMPINRFMLLMGPPGCGKTEASGSILRELLSKKHNCQPEEVAIVIYHLASSGPDEVAGFPLPKIQDGQAITVRTMPELVAVCDKLKETSRTGVVILDEYLQADGLLQIAANQLAREGRVNEYALPEGWGRLLLSNRMHDNCGVNMPFAHFVNGGGLFEVFMPARDYLQHMDVAHGMHPLFSSFVRYKTPDAALDGPGFFDQEVPEDLMSFMTNRSFTVLHDIFMNLSGHNEAEFKRMLDNSAEMTWLQGIADGVIGQTASAEFIGYLKHNKDLRSFDECMANPRGIHVPQALNLQYAYSSLLVSNCTRLEGEELTRYATPMIEFIEYSMPRELRESTIMNCIRASKHRVQLNPAWTDYVIRNKVDIDEIIGV